MVSFANRVHRYGFASSAALVDYIGLNALTFIASPYATVKPADREVKTVINHFP